MARGTAYLVFLIPIIVSVPLAAYVLSDILSQPGRELDMWPFEDLLQSNSATDEASAHSEVVHVQIQSVRHGFAVTWVVL